MAKRNALTAASLVDTVAETPRPASWFRRKFWGVLMILPASVIMGILIFGVVALFSNSVYEDVPITEAGRTAALTSSNYVTVFTDSLYLRPLWRTIRLSLIVVLVSVVLSLALAYWIARAKTSWGSSMLLLLVAVPFFVGHIVKLFALLLVLGNSGLVNYALQLTGALAPGEFVPLIRNERSVLIGLVTFVLPFTTFTLIGTLRRYDRTLEEAAQSLGANPVVTFFRITLPLIAPGVIGAAILAFVLSGTAFATPLILGGGAVPMVANSIFDQAMHVQNLPLASALAVVALVATVAILSVGGAMERAWMKRYGARQ